MFYWLAKSLAGKIDIEIVAYPENGPQDYESLTLRVKSLIGNRFVFLLGESFSSPIAIKTATLIPSQIQALILVSAFTKPPIPSYLIKLASRFRFSAIPIILKEFFLLGGSSPNEVTNKFRGTIAKCDDKVIKSRIEVVANCNVTAEFRSLKIPVLCLHGDRDLLVRKNSMLKTSEMQKSVKFKLVDSPHMLLQTRADIAGRHIIDFISSA